MSDFLNKISLVLYNRQTDLESSRNKLKYKKVISFYCDAKIYLIYTMKQNAGNVTKKNFFHYALVLKSNKMYSYWFRIHPLTFVDTKVNKHDSVIFKNNFKETEGDRNALGD